MNYAAGIDGGASKTHCVIGDIYGNILSEGLSGGSNYQVSGEAMARASIEAALSQALKKLGIKAGDLKYTVLGLSGADMEIDFNILNNICGQFLTPGSFTIVNDTWIGLRAGIPENYGIVTVCGTGGACSGRNSKGLEVTLRNLSYEAGNRGGGSDIAQMALHYAFRSEEKTGRKTVLEDEIPGLFGLKSMDELIISMRTLQKEPSNIYKIPILVCELANKGDAVSQDILINIGHEIGEIAGGVIKRLEMEREVFKVTLIGSVFQSDCPLLMDEYRTTVHRTAPFARISVAQQKPVAGAYHLALERYKNLYG